MKTLTINGIAQLIKIGSEYGLSPALLLNDSGITEAMLLDPHASIRPNQEFKVIRNLRQHVHSKEIGLIVGKRFSLSVLGILGATVPNASNVREAIKLFIHYIQLSYTYFNVSFIEQKQGGSIILADQYELGDLRNFFIDRDIMFTLNAFKDLFPQLPILDGVNVKLGYSRPSNVSSHQTQLNCPVIFREGDTRINIMKHVLDRHLPQSNELTLRLLEQQCIEINNKLSGTQSMIEKVNLMLLENISSSISLENIALSLGLSSRTVRRRLNEEGAQFKFMQNNVKSNEAKRLLYETTWSVERISDYLGYSESASFIHAFKNWTDKSPSQYRKSLR